MTDHQRVIASTRARIGAILGLRAAVAVLSAWLIGWGTTVLVLRGVFGSASRCCGDWWAWPRRPSSARRRPSPLPFGRYRACDARRPLDAAAVADGGRRRRGAGNWPIKVPASAMPSVRWHGGRPCGILLCCAGFLLASFLMPARFLDELGSHRLVVGAEVEKLAEKVELLKEEKILPPERAKSLELALEQLEHDASGSDPAKTWEAMDHLEQSIAQASAEAAEDAARDAEKAARAEELAAALDKARDQMGRQRAERSHEHPRARRAAGGRGRRPDGRRALGRIEGAVRERFAQRRPARRVGTVARKVQSLRSGEAAETGRGQADRSPRSWSNSRDSAKSIPTPWQNCSANARVRRPWVSASASATSPAGAE